MRIVKIAAFKRADRVLREMKVLWELKHAIEDNDKAKKHFAMVVCWEEASDFSYIAYEFAGESIESLVNNRCATYLAQHSETMFSQLMENLVYLHSLSFAHGDVDLSNMVWDGERLRLCDFESARHFKDFDPSPTRRSPKKTGCQSFEHSEDCYNCCPLRDFYFAAFNWKRVEPNTAKFKNLLKVHKHVLKKQTCPKKAVQEVSVAENAKSAPKQQQSSPSDVKRKSSFNNN